MKIEIRMLFSEHACMIEGITVMIGLSNKFTITIGNRIYLAQVFPVPSKLRLKRSLILVRNCYDALHLVLEHGFARALCRYLCLELLLALDVLFLHLGGSGNLLAMKIRLHKRGKCQDLLGITF